MSPLPPSPQGRTWVGGRGGNLYGHPTVFLASIPQEKVALMEVKNFHARELVLDFHQCPRYCKYCCT